MTKITVIKPVVKGVVRNTPKTQQIQFEKSNLPYEMPVDSFNRELNALDKLDPATPLETAFREIQNSLQTFLNK